MTTNDDKAQALIDGLVPKLLESLKEGVSEMVQKEIDPLLKNHSRMQDEFKQRQRDTELVTKLAEQVEGLTGNPVEKPARKPLEFDTARANPTQWAHLKERATELGVPILQRGTDKVIFQPDAG